MDARCPVVHCPVFVRGRFRRFALPMFVRVVLCVSLFGQPVAFGLCLRWWYLAMPLAECVRVLYACPPFSFWFV